ncbi:MAG: SH3 domain-containing protein [Sarcina sp.]
MKQKKLLATVVAVSTICAVHNTNSANKDYHSTSKKITRINKKLLVNSEKTNTTPSNDKNSEKAVNKLGTISASYSQIKVRNSANSSSMVVGKIKKGSTVHITAEKNNWYKIKYNNNYGFVEKNSVNIIPKEKQEATSFATSTESAVVSNLPNGIELHFRSGPGLNYSIISDLPSNTEVTVLSQDGSWSEISYNGQTGYVYNQYLSASNSSSNIALSGSTTGTVCNLSQGISLHVRSGAGLSFNIIGDLNNGDNVNIIKEVGSWYEINYNGQIAYVYSSYVNTNNETSNSSSSNSVPATSETGTVCNLYGGIGLHVRTGPSLDNSIIGDIYEGASVNIIKQVGSWYEINYNGQIAYVYGSYINANNSNTSSSTTSSGNNSIPATTSTGTVCNLSSGIYLHVRTGASLDNSIIGDLSEGTSVNIIKQVGSWYEINYNNQIAYVYASYVNNNSSNNSPSTNSVPATSATGTVCNLYGGIGLHVRTGPSLDNSIIGDIYEGASVNIIKQVGSWYEIIYNGQIAYVYGSYVNPSNSSNNNGSNSSSSNSIPATTSTGTVCNLSSGIYLHVRTGASLDNSIIGDLSEGASINIIKQVGSWYEINYNNQIAYVYGSYVNTNSSSGNNSNNNSNSDNSSSNSPSTGSGNGYNLNFGPNSTIINTEYPGSLQQYIDDQYNNWPYYSPSQYEHYINPASASNVYQFLTINTFRNININELNSALAGQGVLSGQAQGFYNAAKEYNIDPLYLVAQCMLETGHGTSYLASGVTINSIANVNDPIYSNGELVGYQMIPLSQPVTVYNLFGIGAENNSSAFPNRALILGTTYAYEHGWTSVSNAIAGAAQFVSNSYIHTGGDSQITPYEFRYNQNAENIWHQYATTVWYGSSIGALMQELKYIYNPGDNFTFNIPVFSN